MRTIILAALVSVLVTVQTDHGLAQGTGTPSLAQPHFVATRAPSGSRYTGTIGRSS